MRGRPHSSKRARTALGAALAALYALACGSAEHAAIPHSSEADAGADAGTETQVASAVNLCPHIDGAIITPQKIRPEVSAAVTVSATDSDSTVPDLTFAWRATSGMFSESDKAVTSYECAKVGPQQLTITVTDRPGCSVELTISVECLAS